MVYLDNNASTCPNPNMLDSIKREVVEFFGNPSSSHFAGTNSRDAIEHAREKIANALGVSNFSLIFTSGGTESNNMAIFGSELPLICSSIEHSSVYNCNPYDVIPVDINGQLDIPFLKKALSGISSSKIVSVMLANNETGSILDPDSELLKLKERHNFLLHIDAVQGFGKILNYKIPEQVDLLSISAHKIHGLKGVGVLYVKDGIELANPFSKGGSHEFGMRPGTENQMGILSLAYMTDKIYNDVYYQKRIADIEQKRGLLEFLLKDKAIPNCTKNRVINTSNLYFPEVSDVLLFIELLSDEGLYVSGGSACSSGIKKPSRVLGSIFGESDPRTKGSVRFSLSVDTTEQDIYKAADIVNKVLNTYKEIEND